MTFLDVTLRCVWLAGVLMATYGTVDLLMGWLDSRGGAR